MSGRSTLSRLEDGGLNVPRVHLRGPAGVAPAERSDSRYAVGEEIDGAPEFVILRSRDTDLGREVAMKVLREDRGRSPETLARFLAEARVAGRLQHPAILPVYDLGRLPDGRPFLTLKLARGETLEQILAARKDADADRRRRLGILDQLCQAVAYAHSRGVVHGKLSADRVVVGPFGEVTVTDWGPDSGGDKRSDVRAIGRILLRILAGAGEGKVDPGVLDSCGTDAELVGLCRRCLAEEFDDAAAVAADLAGYLATIEERAHRLEVRAIEDRAAAGRARERSDAARAAAAEQRRARRQTLALAGAMLLALLTAGGAWWSIDAGRRERASRASGMVEVALRESARLAGEGNLAQAVAAAERACGLAANDAIVDAQEDRAAARLETMQAALAESTAAADREERRRRLPGILREIRVRRGIDPPALTASAYEKALREYGITLDDGAAERIRNDPLADLLVGAIRDWARVPGEVADAAHLREIAAAVSGSGRDPLTVPELRKAWWDRPGDFELNLDLSERLLRATPARPAQALRHLTVATAIAPKCAGLWVRLGDACRQAGDGRRAGLAYQYAVDLDPDWEVARGRLR